MAYIFMDESGDLGFMKNKKSSNYFIVTFLFVLDKKLLSKITKKIFRGLKKKNIKVSGGVLHATKEKPITRKRLLKLCSHEEDLSIMTIYLDKSKVYSRLHDEKHILYNYIVNILIDRIITKKLLPVQKSIQFIASRRETSKILNDNFVAYLSSMIKSHPIDIKFLIKTPHEEKGLQVVDFICWAIYQKYERRNSNYYNIIQHLISEEKGLFS